MTTTYRVGLWVLLCGAAQPALSVTDAAERRFIWHEANSRAAAARTAADFSAAARTYGELVAKGARNGPVFYNLGTALIQAGDYDGAVRALLRSERYAGSTPEIRRNLLLAMAGEGKERTVRLPWYRTLLFWHYGLPAATRLTLAAAAFSACWLALLLRRISAAPALAGPLLAASVVALMLFGSSAATSLREERAADRAPPAGAEQKAARPSRTVEP